ncbi:MAG: HD domain-containing protein, partial [Coprothermobacterota bacterium]|nr:HD domain-containing protein [Coprothermobacterota bacterium]
SDGAILFANGVAHQLFPDLEEQGLQHPFLSGLPSAFAIMEQQRLDTFVREVTVDHAIFQQALYATPGRRSLRIYALDMTDRQQTEQALRVSEQRYRILVERSLAGVFRTTRDGQILDCNDAFAQIFGFHSRQEILSHQAQVFYTNPQHREAFIRRLTLEGSLTDIEQQVRRRDGVEVWILENASLIVGESGAMITIQGTVIDITQRKISQQLLEETLVKLSQRLEQTVQALATLAEMKDPYTAGHQTHVSQLTGAIGREMKLDGETLECLRVAATLHDLGKLYVPAEILSKPGKLNTLEFRMIQTHSQVGYEILKGIDFPWPVAEIVLQHHERKDGSGYPRAMKGEEILLEARIIAVADVVEAMSYHRPYRPALGVEKALEEIRSHRVTLFDEEVVAACLRIFETGEFRFQN